VVRLLCCSPGRDIGPLSKFALRPLSGFVGVAARAAIWHFELLRFRWRNESEGVTANIEISDLCGDLWHMAPHAFIAGTPGRVVSVIFNPIRPSELAPYIANLSDTRSGAR
jgi:hypothetical protein